MNTSKLKSDELLNEFRSCQSSARLEELADQIGQERDTRAIPELLARLGDDRVQEDRDVEDAVCGALVKLGAMRKFGNLNFRLVDFGRFDIETFRSIQALRPRIPEKYF